MSDGEDERVKEAQQDAVKMIDQLEGIEDLLSRGPWEASQPDPFPYKVTIGNYTFDCPIGSSQIRAEQSSIPSHCLIPSGIIHHDDAEGIAELRNLIPTLIATLRSLLPVQPAPDEKEVTRRAKQWLDEYSDGRRVTDSTTVALIADLTAAIRAQQIASEIDVPPVASTPTGMSARFNCNHEVVEGHKVEGCPDCYPTAASTEAQVSLNNCTCEYYWHNPQDHDAGCPASKSTPYSGNRDTFLEAGTNEP